MSVIQILSNAVVGKLVGAPREDRLEVSSLLSYQVAGSENMNSVKSGSWDGRSTFYDFKTDTFPAGFVDSVAGLLMKRGHTVQFVRKPLPEALGPLSPVVDQFGEDPKYSYQNETVDILLKRGRGIAQVATGGGKSRICKKVFARINRKTLFITTRGVLLYQMKTAFERDMKIPVGMIGDSVFAPCDGMNVAMVQTLAQAIEKKTLKSEIQIYKANTLAAEVRKIESMMEKLKKEGKSRAEILKIAALENQRLENARLSKEEIIAQLAAKIDRHEKRRERTIEFLQSVEVIIAEEAHEASSNSYYDILQFCKRANYRLALTATPFMRSEEEQNMRLMASVGRILIRVTEKDLIDKGILAKPFFKFVSTPCPPKLYRSTAWQRAYQYGIVHNESRNRVIVEEAIRATKHGLPVMILCGHVAHGEMLERMLKISGIAVKFIHGKHEEEERTEALRQLGSGKIQALIGSTILDVGVDVPSVGMVILAGGGKAEIALRQRIGRGLRAKKSGPNIAFILDFNDEHNTHLSDHARTRRAIIESTPGFAENILPAGADFDYSQFA